MMEGTLDRYGMDFFLARNIKRYTPVEPKDGLGRFDGPDGLPGHGCGSFGCKK